MRNSNETVITGKMLRGELRGCALTKDIEIFEETFPNGARVNKRNINKALKLGLNLGWFCTHFLPPALIEEYQTRRNAVIADHISHSTPHDMALYYRWDVLSVEYLLRWAGEGAGDD